MASKASIFDHIVSQKMEINILGVQEEVFLMSAFNYS